MVTISELKNVYSSTHWKLNQSSADSSIASSTGVKNEDVIDSSSAGHKGLQLSMEESLAFAFSCLFLQINIFFILEINSFHIENDFTHLKVMEKEKEN